MSRIKSKIEAVVTLSPSTCYYMKTGKCSLNVVTDYYVSASSKTAANELLFCPRLYSAMRGREKMKPISVTPCECGHTEVVSGHQRACIASQKGIEMSISLAAKKPKANCPICGGQLTFEKNSGENRFIRLKVSADDEQ